MLISLSSVPLVATWSWFIGVWPLGCVLLLQLECSLCKYCKGGIFLIWSNDVRHALRMIPTVVSIILWYRAWHCIIWFYEVFMTGFPHEIYHFPPARDFPHWYRHTRMLAEDSPLRIIIPTLYSPQNSHTVSPLCCGRTLIESPSPRQDSDSASYFNQINRWSLSH